MKRTRKFSAQFLWIVGSFVLLFLVGMSVLLSYQSVITATYEEENRELEKRRKSVAKIDNSFTQAVAQSRGYIAFSNTQMLDDAFKQEKVIKQEIVNLSQLAKVETDLLFVNEVSSFSTFYFRSLIKDGVTIYQDKGLEALREFVQKGNSSEQVANFNDYVKQYRESINKQIDDNSTLLVKQLNQSQWLFVGYLLLVLAGLFYMTRVMLKRIGQPLEKLAMIAVEVEQGKVVMLPEAVERTDEIGTLTSAFSKMVKRLQANEEEVTAQNEELVAQQDELQSQQDELHYALTLMKQRELELEARNEFTHGLADTLDQQKLLQSVVENMARVIKAEHGFIVSMMNLNEYASVGLTKTAVAQVLENIDNGYVEKVKEQKKSFTIKRVCEPSEKIYHEGHLYMYDLIVPVLSLEDEVISCMFYSRYSEPFTERDLELCEALSKQISIALEKIHVYEETEHDRLLYQDILNSIHEGVQLFSKSGVILQVNTTMCELFDCPPPRQMLHHTFDEWSQKLLWDVKNGERLVHYMKSMLEGEGEVGQTFIYEMNQETKRKVMQVYCEQVYRNNKKYGVIFVHRDITKEYEVDEMKSEFVSTVSHELRTPLASVLGFTELMLNKELKPERQKKYLTTIYQEAKRLTALINDFLDVQRMEAGKQSYEKKQEDIVSIAKQVIQAQEIAVSAHTIDLVTKTEHSFVLGDRDKLIQVFNNLLNNAIKYSPEGGKVLVLIEERDQQLCVDVKDEGIGIPPESIDQLFMKFYRVDNSDMRKIGGTGLGLAIVKEIIKAHGGNITVQSELKKGSTFTVSLPLISKPKKVHTSHKREQEHANVVIIEDDQSLATLLQEELKERGFYVQYFNNGEDALTFIEGSPPQAIVLDLMLKENELDGWAILEKLKKDERLATIPIFISSALDEQEKGLALGAQYYLTKPYQPSQLSKAIIQVVLNKHDSSS
ncbi:ATP-binding protein [Bacillus sp. CGMCC 1.16541]|uniref:ATP-binding protein n=1 Tax=Bacillus sp. CGMCC 1.16541 TaxID=2185143 RepID=UPI000D72E55B|nr:ATP-binding protein [Bacillus sp. CGMCC 1.16541]